MTFVVTEPCIDCKYTDCAVVCPCDCFREGEKMLYIDPLSCIDCGACESECPVSAIYREDEVPAKWVSYIAINAEQSQRCPPITEKKQRTSASGSP